MGRGIDRPKILAATHFHEIFENGFLKNRPSLSYGYMEVRLNREAEDLEDQVTYLYKYELRQNVSALLTGTLALDTVVATPATVAGEPWLSSMISSLIKFSCAALNGVDAAIVERANYLVDISAKGEDLVTACAKISKKEEDELKDAVSGSGYPGTENQH